VVSTVGLFSHQIHNRQTVFHDPSPRPMFGYSVSSSLQIGDPAVVANECEVPVVGDFRMADISVGGQGAPLIPYMDKMVLEKHFKKTGRVGVMLNIGGISNMAALVTGASVFMCEFMYVRAFVCMDLNNVLFVHVQMVRGVGW